MKEYFSMANNFYTKNPQFDYLDYMSELQKLKKKEIC